MNPEHASTPERQNALPGDVEARVQIVVEEFLAALQAGEGPERAQVVAQHANLAPWLDERLKLVELVFHAAQDGDAAGNGRLPGDQAKRLKCPHCGNQVQWVEPRPKELTCLNCGSSFRLEPDSTVTFRSSRPEGEFGRFQVVELLGRGAFGEVYKAHDRELDRFVALKVPRADYFANAEETQRFLREARAAAGLRHSNIVQVHEIAHERGLAYIVSEYIEGLTLADLISGGRPGFRESAELLAQLADAVDYAHRQKVVHRDIKPSNVLLAAPEGNHAAGPRFVPYLTDFGLARRDEGEITVTLDGQVLGTPAYMSPEQAAGDHARVDGRSDVYSLGVVLYELLSGELPFRGSRRMLLHQVLHDEPRPPRTLNDRIPRDLETICLKALAKEPGRRYATAADLRDDLRRFLSGDPITARRVGRTERAWRWCRRNPVIATLSSTAMVLLVAVATVSTLAYLRESQLVGEKDGLIRDKDGLIAEKEALILEKDREATRADRANEAAQRELYGVRIARATAYLGANDYRAATESLASIPMKRRGWEYYHLWRRSEGTPLTLRSHSDLNSVSYSPDGTRLAAASSDNTVKLWDAQTGTELQALRGHTKKVTAVSFSPDGARLASASEDEVVKLWDAQTGAELRTLYGHTDRVTSVSFSPDGTRLASGSDDQTTKLWDAQTGAELRSLHGHTDKVTSVSFNPEGTRLASGSDDQTVKLWDARTGAELQTLHGHTDKVASVSFSPDGTRLASGAYDKTVRLWNAPTGAELQTLRREVKLVREVGHTDKVLSVSFSPDGTRLASGSVDKTVKLWDAATGVELETLRGNAECAHSVSFSPDGTRLASASCDGTVKLWDIQPEAEPQTLRGHAGAVASVSFSPNSTRVASGSWDGTVKLWDTQSGMELLTLRPLSAIAKMSGLPDAPGLNPWVTAVSFNPDGTRLASASRDGTVNLWDGKSSTELHTLPPGQAVLLSALSFNADGTRVISASSQGRPLASGSWEWTVTLWDAQSGAPLHVLSGDSKSFTSLSFSPDGTQLASGSSDGTVKLWDAQSGFPLQTLRGHIGYVPSLSFSRDGTRLASGSGDETIKLWDVQTGVELQTLRGHSHEVISLSFSPDGTRLASASSDRTVKLWDAQTGAELLTLRGHSDLVQSVSFSSDGTRLASASIDQTIKLWDTRCEADLQTLRGHTSAVTSVSFSRNGMRLVSRDNGLVTRGNEKTLVWKLPDGELLPDEPVPDADDLADQSPDPLLRAVARGLDIQLIRKNAKYDPWNEDAERRKKLLPKWHADDAAKAEAEENWFAAVFHLQHLSRLKPEDEEIRERLAEAIGASGPPSESQSLGKRPANDLPSMPLRNMALAYVNHAGEIISVRLSDREKSMIASPAGAPRWIGWNRRERQWMALIDRSLVTLPEEASGEGDARWTFPSVPVDFDVTTDGQLAAWTRRIPGDEVPDGDETVLQEVDGKEFFVRKQSAEAAWSSDASRVAFLSSEGKGDWWKIGVRHGSKIKWIRNVEHPFMGVSPCPSPDGALVAYCGPVAEGNVRSIHIISVDGRQTRTVTHNNRLNGKPAFSPDGRYLAYLTWTNDRCAVAYTDLESDEETVLGTDARDIRPAWRDLETPEPPQK